MVFTVRPAPIAWSPDVALDLCVNADLVYD